MVTPLPLNQWLVGNLQGGLRDGVGPSHFPATPLESHHNNHTMLSTRTHTGLAEVASPASQTDCSLSSHPSLGSKPTNGMDHPELSVPRPFLALSQGRKRAPKGFPAQGLWWLLLLSESNPTVRPSSLTPHLTFLLASAFSSALNSALWPCAGLNLLRVWEKAPWILGAGLRSVGVCHLLGHSVAVSTQISSWRSALMIQYSLCARCCANSFYIRHLNLSSQ